MDTISPMPSVQNVPEEEIQHIVDNFSNPLFAICQTNADTTDVYVIANNAENIATFILEHQNDAEITIRDTNQQAVITTYGCLLNHVHPYYTLLAEQVKTHLDRNMNTNRLSNQKSIHMPIGVFCNTVQQIADGATAITRNPCFAHVNFPNSEKMVYAIEYTPTCIANFLKIEAIKNCTDIVFYDRVYNPRMQANGTTLVSGKDADMLNAVQTQNHGTHTNHILLPLLDTLLKFRFFRVE